MTRSREQGDNKKRDRKQRRRGMIKCDGQDAAGLTDFQSSVAKSVLQPSSGMRQGSVIYIPKHKCS